MRTTRKEGAHTPRQVAASIGELDNIFIALEAVTSLDDRSEMS